MCVYMNTQRCLPFRTEGYPGAGRKIKIPSGSIFPVPACHFSAVIFVDVRNWSFCFVTNSRHVGVFIMCTVVLEARPSCTHIFKIIHRYMMWPWLLWVRRKLRFCIRVASFLMYRQCVPSRRANYEVLEILHCGQARSLLKLYRETNGE